MSKHITGFRIAILMVFALIVLTVSQTGYSQNATPFGQSVQCQPFQQSVGFDLFAGDTVSTGTFTIAKGTRVTFEQISLRIDATDAAVVPTLATLVTTVGRMTSAYYVPIPADVWLVARFRPLGLMQSGPLHADGGTTVWLSVSVDSRYTSGSGRAEWSVSGQTCVA